MLSSPVAAVFGPTDERATAPLARPDVSGAMRPGGVKPGWPTILGLIVGFGGIALVYLIMAIVVPEQSQVAQ